MKIICSHPYKKVVRNIDSNEQQYVETEEHIRLYKDKIVTESHSFQLQQVLDVSFKSLSDHTGFLYLHTNRGVHSFHVKKSPDLFISEYKKLKKSN